MNTKRSLIIALLASSILVMGCAKRYIITDELSGDIPPSASILIGEIVDELPLETDEDDRPSIENIDAFKINLEHRLEEKELFDDVAVSNHLADHEVTGSIVSFSRGSGFLRFLFGFVGSSEVTVALKVTNMKSGQVVFGGNFTGAVTSGYEKSDKMFDSVAKDFAKALEKELMRE